MCVCLLHTLTLDTLYYTFYYTRDILYHKLYYTLYYTPGEEEQGVNVPHFGRDAPHQIPVIYYLPRV